VAAALVVIADLGLTGMLHFDGLMDSADGLLPPLEPHRRLEVMADPRVGAFGVAAGIAVLLARWAALAALRPGILLLGGLWCLSRTAMAVVVRTQPYARPEGLAAPFGAVASNAARLARRWVPQVVGVALAGALLVLWRPGPGAAAGAVAAVVAAAVIVLARRRINGYTGDVLGACGVLAESAGLIVAAARW
jgi:adenosylcobinamide-GDP ribazoletransferase